MINSYHVRLNIVCDEQCHPVCRSPNNFHTLALLFLTVPVLTEYDFVVAAINIVAVLVATAAAAAADNDDDVMMMMMMMMMMMTTTMILMIT